MSKERKPILMTNESFEGLASVTTKFIEEQISTFIMDEEATHSYMSEQISVIGVVLLTANTILHEMNKDANFVDAKSADDMLNYISNNLNCQIDTPEKLNFVEQ